MSEEFVVQFGPTVGLSYFDLALLICCPIFAALGTIVSGTIKNVSSRSELEEGPESEEAIEFQEATELPPSFLKRIKGTLTDEEKLTLYNESMGVV